MAAKQDGVAAEPYPQYCNPTEEQKDMITILFNNSITVWNGQIHKAKQGREKITSMAALGKYSHMKFSSLLGEVRKKPHGLGRN